ncbi:methyl-accepting chemotaxis protein, partial [Burkholderia contaminans]
MNDRQLTVRTKLTLAFSLLTCMVLLVSILGIVSLGNANAAFENYVHGINARATLADKILAAVDRRAIAARNQVLATAPRDADIEKEAALRADREVGALLGELTNAVREGSGATDKARELVRQIGAVEAQYGPVARAIVEAAANNRRDQAITMINEQCRPLLAQLVAATDANATFSRTMAAQLVKESDDRYTSRRLMLIAISIAAAAAAAISGLF